MTTRENTSLGKLLIERAMQRTLLRQVKRGLPQIAEVERELGSITKEINKRMSSKRDRINELISEGNTRGHVVDQGSRVYWSGRIVPSYTRIDLSVER